VSLSVERCVTTPQVVPDAWKHGPDRDVSPRTVLDLFDDHVAARPDAPAAMSGGRSLTYRQLDALAGGTAERLGRQGVRPGDRVAVLMERSVSLPVALVAVWKAGAVYVPVDPDYPADRVRYLLSDCAARVVLTEAALLERVPAGTAVVLDDRQANGPTGGAVAPRPLLDDLAYVVYTSGSTGQPKGVEVTHRSLGNVVAELTRVLRADAAQQWLTMAPASFDISMAELCLPLATGARVAVTSSAEARDAARLVRLIDELGVTRMQAVPAQWQALVDADLRAPELVGMVGGEALPTGLANELTSRISLLFNGYGPTETTVLSTIWPVPAGADEICIGRPIANTRLYLLDERLEEVPVGEAGDLYIAGTGVARGYLGRPDLTDGAFLTDPWGPPGARMYRTGDRCRWRPDGCLVYLGRDDGQVKVRGQRIETGEVEACLMRCPGVAAATVVVRGQSLVAYVTAASVAPVPAPVPAQVRAFVAASLTPAMVPGTVVVLDAFPLTPNGKIDRAALPDPAGTGSVPGPAAPAASAVDAFTGQVCALITEILDVPPVRPGDDFFELGGNSVAVMRVAAIIAQRWSVEVPTEVFYDTETIADLAAAIQGLMEGGR
jgi:amino acid adenylation domain-containing protein